MGEITTFGYDAAGNQSWIEDATGGRTDYEYDSLNRRVRTILPATQTGGERVTLGTGYDALGLRTVETNELGIISRFGYDRLGRLLAVTNAWNTDDATWVTYAYDELSNQVTQTDALDRTTTFAYDALGHRIRRTLPGGQSETLVYNSVGNLIQHNPFDASRPPITYSYDTANRLMSKSAGQTVLVRYTYTPDGHRATMTDSLGQTVYTYDPANRLARKSVPLFGDSGRVLSYTYDPNGNVASIKSFPANNEAEITTHLRYEYDALNRLKNTIVADPGIGSERAVALYEPIPGSTTTVFFKRFNTSYS